jgi:hypothetical protein
VHLELLYLLNEAQKERTLRQKLVSKNATGDYI